MRSVEKRNAEFASPKPAPATAAPRATAAAPDPAKAPYDELRWELREASITDGEGKVLFNWPEVEVPATWSQRATAIVAHKYLRRNSDGTPAETSVRQLLDRVVDTIAGWGRSQGYFGSDDAATSFAADLRRLLVQQRASFNSPVWFNVGVSERPQCSACFINSVADDMGSIFDLAKIEGLLFKHGSGAGCNLSSLRSSEETLAGGGTASGPVSFMRGYDAFAGVIKSGGRTRRAAKMVILDVDHPDVLDFIDSKASEERKAHALIRAGYDPSFDAAGGAYDSVFFQNANHSVRVSDEFMAAVEADAEWVTHAVTDGRPMRSHPARFLLRRIAEATWQCGDPGMQFDTTINRWHTCAASGRIRASNPCSEFMFLDDTACNLASLNLLKFFDPESGRFEAEAFVHACELLITAQDILVDNAGYPSPAIARNSHEFRPLGLGYANLGALLMALGLPYDSEPARAWAATITALMTGAAYSRSARLAGELGAFERFEENRDSMLGVIRRHRQALTQIDEGRVPAEMTSAAHRVWDGALEGGRHHGFRNSQVTVLAPTGTIAFMMDCETTGIEPDIALVKLKTMVGGGSLRMTNGTVPLALRRLGYAPAEVTAIVEHLEKQGTIADAPGLAPEHLAIFDCALKPAAGGRAISTRGHLEMMAAVQPFLSGAISKTINLPAETTIEEIERAYLEAWRAGLKAVALYRDGCKLSQPLATAERASAEEEAGAPRRRRLPDERVSITHKFSVGGHEGYITVGLYEDGTPGEIFVVMAKEGSTISGLMDSFATAVSIALQYGVPLPALISKFSHTRFEPAGMTNNPEIPIAKSIMDYIARWLASKFMPADEQRLLGILVERSNGSKPKKSGSGSPRPRGGAPVSFLLQQDAPSCQECGSIMVRSGSCYHCQNCGATTGCG